ncbi:hypothetical protein [Sinorhizobium americanum]|uniref:Uncharacterized protein n=1 Tax=Sinorhizobium americanum TaxID=194963 RepID=A0A4R2C5X2_9HYPH|nr:hypothetical protein [Sinorhizobium americanum]TCN34124.1 hypothetical protein EV184_102436 [Sinorhizobium americanum]
MSLTTDFIVELIRAANEAEQLTPVVVNWLFNRSIATIRDLRDQTGIRGSNRAKDVLIDLHQASAKSDRLAPDEIRDALIDAADVIRTLKIALDVKA